MKIARGRLALDMLSEEKIREELSIAYLHAVAARAGYAWEPTRVDLDGIDGWIRSRGRISADARIHSPMIGFQLKATSTIQGSSDPIGFALKQKNYDDLRKQYAEPRYLALLLLPEDPEDWLKLDANEMVMRRCMYWHSLAKAAGTDNASSTTVYLSRNNVLDVRSLRGLMMDASRGEAS